MQKHSKTMTQREIKFRGWDGFKMTELHGKLLEAVENPALYGFKTTMQFTGLKDSKGVEIFEGDIVRWGMDKLESEIRIAEVKLSPDITFDCKNIKYPHIFHFGNFIYQETEKYLEIIGNVYENSELLKS
jgi:uncharacterized phage protein (TIGR01671 family)